MKRNDLWSSDMPDMHALYDTAEFTAITEGRGLADVADVIDEAAGFGDLVGMPADMGALEEHVTLCEVLDRVLNKGVVVRGDIILSVAGIDLVYLGLDVLLCGAERAYELGYLRPAQVGEAFDLPGALAAAAPDEGAR